MRRAVFFIAGLLLALCAKSLIGHSATQSLLPGSQTIELDFQEQHRSYIVHLPPQAKSGKALPLVLNFHGGGSNAVAEERYSGMDTTADRNGFIAVYPNGSGHFGRALTWNAGRCCAYAMRKNIDDVGFARAVINDLATRTSIDRSRVYATGMSNGAMMAYRLGAKASDLIAAIAPVEGAMVVDTKGPSRPVSLMAFNSTDDPFVPYDGGYGRMGGVAHGDLYPPVSYVLGQWRMFDDCPVESRTDPEKKGAPRSPDANNTATRIVWAPCKMGTEVVLWKLSGSGHVWPGGTRGMTRLLGPSTDLIDASEMMWEFFRRFSLLKK